MKKERDSFFSQYGVNAYNQNPYMYPNMNNQNYNPMDLESRINRLEKEINNLNQRISKLENNLNQPINNDYNFANSMYMV